ncbi:MAG TPA: UDP-glucose 4-epimerase GalE [Synergistales bacterium]|nr:UDP-glucose 4-epimerase GalE [Synergistales bacterium]
MLLVTGGAGYIGSHVALELRRRGRETLIFDDLSKGHRDLAGDAPFEEGDLKNLSRVREVFTRYSIDGVLHFAAKSLVGESMAMPMDYYRNNVVGTINLLTAMEEHGVKRMVFSSTAAVYGEPETTPIYEDAALKPTNVYGDTKLFIESMLRNLHRAMGLCSTSLRYFNAAGADPSGEVGEDHTPETHLIPLALDVALGKREKLQIFGNDYRTPDGTCVRDYVHVTDLAMAHVKAIEMLEAGVAGCEAFNLGNGKGFSVLEIIDSVRKVTGHPIPVEFSGRRPGDPAVLVASSKKAEKNLGWQRNFPGIEEIVSTAWQWHKNRHGR